MTDNHTKSFKIDEFDGIEEGETINVTATNRIFEVLKNNNNDFESLLADLINNCIASRVGNKVTVVIEIYISETHPEKNYIIIRDNASGMELKVLENAISPGKSVGTHPLHKHGLGQKQSIPGLGKLSYLATKTKNNKKAIIIDKFAFGYIKTKKVNVDFEHGTIICIKNLNQGKNKDEKNIVYSDQKSYTRFLVKQLGTRYRRFLDPKNPKLDLSIKYFNIDNNFSLKQTWNIKPVHPVYSDFETGENIPREKNVLFHGDEWKATLTYGYSASEEDYETLKLEKPTSDHPYFKNKNHQGFDLIIHDVVLKRNQLSEINLVSTKHDSYNYVRGEIDLIEGFSTNTTKDNIINNKNFAELINKIKKYLTKNKYLKPIPRKITEDIYVDRFIKKIEFDSLLKSIEEPIREYSVKGINSRFDVYFNKCAYEFKLGEIKWKHAYELVGYLQNSNMKKGFLIAESIDSNVLSVFKLIKEQFDMEIQFLSFKKLNIDGPLTKEERLKRYNNFYK